MDTSDENREFEHTFRGQRFRVTQRAPGENSFDIEWLTGPTPRLPTWLEGKYGFSMASNGSDFPSIEAFDRSISSFLVGFYADAAEYYERQSRKYVI
ncbi:hypothetical protein GCM10022286_30040 [Gryllotalpicola daejeonensis]|uniref:Uncharacterized protein n=1 Tax=Gryllotalpicola daejeonensis TaxID=993087 RepID=A0ABP7ZNP0_9MICO